MYFDIYSKLKFIYVYHSIYDSVKHIHNFILVQFSKILNISFDYYRPIPPNYLAPKYQTAYACEGKKLTIECDPGDLINLIRANYGRFSITICNDHGNVEWSVNCMFPKSLPVLNSRCANKQSCSVLATTSMFGDPCPGTHKYLEAHYQCVSAAQTLTTTNRPSPPIVHSNNLPSAPLPPLLANGSTLINGAHIPPPPRMPSSFIAVTPSTSTSTPLIPHPTGSRMHYTTLSSELGVIKTGSLPLPPHSLPPVVHHHHHAVNPAIRPPIPSSGVGGEHIVLGAPKPTMEASPLSSTSSSITITHKGVQSSTSPNTRILSGVGGSGSSDDRSTQQQQPQYQPKVTSAAGSSNISVATVIRTINNINTANITEAEANMFCSATMARNLFWNMTRVGDVNVQPCPAGSTGIAKWRCVLMKKFNEDNVDVTSTTTTRRPLQCLNGTCETPMVMANKMNQQRNFEPTWHPLTPDLTQCRSLWLNSLELRVNQRDSSLISIANDLSEVTSSKILYGGDMLVTTKIIQTMSEKMYHDKETFPDQRQREAIIMELLHGVVKTGSNLLDVSQLSSWLDLNQEDQMRVATSLLTGLEYNAFLLADTIIRERNVVQKVKNILLSVRVLETKNIQANEIFPEPEQWHISNDRIELPRAALMENSEGGLVRIVFAAFDRLESILKPSYDHFDVKSARTYVKTTAHLSNDTDDSASSPQRMRILNSKVISASLGKGRHIQLSQPIKLILKHIKVENVTNPTCVFWNYIDHAWSANGCTLEATNRSHSICMCNHLTNFALLMDVIDEHTHSLFTMFNGNMRVLIYISVGICVVFIVIALMTLKIFNGVFIKTTRTLIYRNIYVCLLLNEVVFLVGIELTDTNLLCGFTTVFIHLFVFATIAWFCFEAFQSYSILTTDDMILEVDQTCKVNCYYMISYGLSISTVALALFIKASSYTASDFCVLMAVDNLFYFSFVAPVILFVVGFLVYTFLSWLIMCRKSRTTLKNKEHTRLANVRFDIRCSIIFLLMLIAVWTSAYNYLRLAKMDDEMAVLCGYLFVGFNTAMGFYIFVFHCIQNEKIRREYRKYVRQNAWLPKCLRCSKTSISSGIACGGVGTGTTANANNCGTSGSGSKSMLTGSNPIKHKLPIDVEETVDNEETGGIVSSTEDAIIATSDCELNESATTQNSQSRRTVGGTLKSLSKPVGGGTLSGNLMKSGDIKVIGPGPSSTLRCTGGAVNGGLQTPSLGHTSPTSSVGSTKLIFGHGIKHQAGQVPAAGSGINVNPEAFYYHPDYYSWNGGRHHQQTGGKVTPHGEYLSGNDLSPQHLQQQQQPHEIFYWTQKHNQNNKKKKRGGSAAGVDSPSGSLHSRTTAAASQQILFYPSYKKTSGQHGQHPQYAQYAEAIEPYYQEQQQPSYDRRHHMSQTQYMAQQQLSSDDEQMEPAAHAHLLHLGRRGGPQLPPVPPSAISHGVLQGDFRSQQRYYRNKHSNCDLNQKYDETGLHSNSEAYYNHGSINSSGDGPVYEEILSNHNSDKHYDVGDDDDEEDDFNHTHRAVVGSQRIAGHRLRRRYHYHPKPYHDRDDEDDGNNDELHVEDESVHDDDDNDVVYKVEDIPHNTNERMQRLMAMQDEDFERRFQRQQRKNAINHEFQQQREFDLHQPQKQVEQHFSESNAIFGVVRNADGGGGSVRTFQKCSPNHHSRGGVLDNFPHGPPLPPANHQQPVVLPISSQQQQPVGRNISAMLDENNTVRCYLEPLNK